MQSLSQKKLKEITKLQQKKYREETGLVLIEGKRLIEQVLTYNIIPEELYLLDPKESSYYKAKNIFQITEIQLRKITNTKNPQSVAALVKKKIINFREKNFILYLDSIKEPGNLGTIIRTALAMNIDGIALSPFCCEYYNPKVIRSSLGAVFKLPIEIQDHNWLKLQDASIIALDLDDAIEIKNAAKPEGNMILVIGSEAFGISEQLLSLADMRVKIPISENIESLNAAIAAAIAMFHFTS